MNGHITHEYKDDYKEICFQVWYAAGKPIGRKVVEDDILPPDEYGRKPNQVIFNRWRREMAWDARANSLDTEAILLAETQLVMQKAEMLKRHAEDAHSIAMKARDFLLNEGFDSSAAAVRAYFDATGEERLARGISDLIVKMSKMSNNELQAKILDLLRRGSENEQIIDSDVVEESTEDSAASSS